MRSTQPTMDTLRDQTYRSMLRLDAGKEGAVPSLCVALAEAWNAVGTIGESRQFGEWLRKITPICLIMISHSRCSGSGATYLKQQQRYNKHISKKGMQTIMEVKVTHLDNVRFSIQAREHTIISDQPTDNGGQDTGMTPPELLLASLGSCAAFYAAQYLKTRNLSESTLTVTVTAEKLKQPARMGTFRIHVDCPVPLSEDQKQALLRSVHQCLVHNTLLSQPDIALALTTPESIVAG
ncbi:MAG TPA: OsmC family protein [Acidisarcina sp.]|nr:OsmC family protein [Acidisarcina sp.]